MELTEQAELGLLLLLQAADRSECHSQAAIWGDKKGRQNNNKGSALPSCSRSSRSTSVQTGTAIPPLLPSKPRHFLRRRRNK